MPLTVPTLDTRRFQDLQAEARARIPVHNPEWTNYSESDPGMTLLDISVFMTETLLYVANRYPENNRHAFLSLLGIPLQPATSARGLVAFANDRGPLQVVPLNNDVEVRAGQVPFRTERGLDVLPLEAQIYYKQALPDPDGRLTKYYQQLYASYLSSVPQAQPNLYQTVPFLPTAINAIDLGTDTIDNSLWVALLVRSSDASDPQSIDVVRQAIAGRTLSLGIVPLLADASRQLTPGSQVDPQNNALLLYQIPNSQSSSTSPTYRALISNPLTDVLAEPGVVELTLPGADELTTWSNLDPLTAGTGNLPPALQDTSIEQRLVTWLRITSTASVQAQLLWAGINATTITQSAPVFNEQLPPGTGEPDQAVTLAKTPIVPSSVSIYVTLNGTTEQWQEIDDLLKAGPEVPTIDPRLPPSAPQAPNPNVKVFTVDPEAGLVSFGDGTHGARPPFGAIMRANYKYGVGSAGNVGAGTINSGPTLPGGMKVNNPIRTWGGADAETVSDGEKQIARYLQHRDRLVSATDFQTITLRTPGVDIGRVEVLPAFNPALVQNEPGDAPGAVTLMVIPSNDPVHPDAPGPDNLFLDTICSYLDQRRLVTTEVFVSGPIYKPVWVSLGIQAVPGMSPAQVQQDVKQAVTQFLSPLPSTPGGQLDAQSTLLSAPQYMGPQTGWLLRKPVIDLELLAVASRVPGVWLVQQALVALDQNPPTSQIPFSGLELPHLVGISVSLGDALSIDQLRGQSQAPARPVFVSIPVIPEECQ